MIHQSLARADNFAVLVRDRATGATAAIDAPDDAAIEQALAATGWGLTHILVTHEHLDHVEGIPALKARHGCRVVAPARARRVPLVEVAVKEGDEVAVGGLRFTVLETPGHCPDHVAYWLPKDGVIFVGDTLFSLGCGRMLGSTAAEFHASLRRLAALPPATKVYCGHEYTLGNARFALTVEPDNADLKARALAVEAARARGQMTLPTTIGDELLTNPFLRAPDAETFARLRAAKDGFR